MKKWYHSKTICFNLITIALGIIGVINDVYAIDPKSLALVNGIGNVFLRFLTTQKIGFGPELAREPVLGQELDFDIDE